MTSTTAPDTMTDDAHEVLEFTGDITDYWSYTQIRDWVLLQPDMTRTALHLYLLLRSMVSESVRRNGGALRRMPLDQLCRHLPSVNGKPASLTMIKDALRLLAAALRGGQARRGPRGVGRATRCPQSAGSP
ncbi:hypothetical protein ABT009_37465 [Streptomyces sp. NPDC002896]|uniref:hypothetical protein n=1 Tax=Streptomyces sp. NPDC002896 TaxID=3154438 RepID=UPI00332E65D8